MDLIAKMDERHSNKARLMLYAWGGSVNDIIKDAEESVGQQNDVMKMFGQPPITEEDAAEDAYWAIVKRCKAMYLAPITRDHAAAIVSAITAYGVLHLADDIEFNAWGFADAWNDAHPSEKPISPYGDADIDIG